MKLLGTGVYQCLFESLCIDPFFITLTKYLKLGNLIEKRGLFWFTVLRGRECMCVSSCLSHFSHGGSVPGPYLNHLAKTPPPNTQVG